MMDAVIPDKIETHVVIQRVLCQRTAHAALPNGKIVLAFIDAKKPPFPLVEGSAMRVRKEVAYFTLAEILGG
ncbi:MAG: hypothetical protein JNG86_01080 [Verrucomicrobiaceae bacterium]|nr:hypothetical protein [Verrucomicrobiaceae bacterium]